MESGYIKPGASSGSHCHRRSRCRVPVVQKEKSEKTKTFSASTLPNIFFPPFFVVTLMAAENSLQEDKCVTSGLMSGNDASDATQDTVAARMETVLGQLGFLVHAASSTRESMSRPST